MDFGTTAYTGSPAFLKTFMRIQPLDALWVTHARGYYCSKYVIHICGHVIYDDYGYDYEHDLLYMIQIVTRMIVILLLIAVMLRVMMFIPQAAQPLNSGKYFKT